MPVAELDALLDGAALDGAPRAERRVFLGALARRAHPVGDLVFLEGEPGDAVMLLAAGEVAITRRSLAGDVVELGRVAAGDFVGEVGVLSGGVRGATVLSTRADTVALALGRDAFFDALAHGDRAAMALLRSMNRRLAQRVRATEARVALVRDALAGEEQARVDARLAELGHVEQGPDAWRRELLPFFSVAR